MKPVVGHSPDYPQKRGAVCALAYIRSVKWAGLADGVEILSACPLRRNTRACSSAQSAAGRGGMIDSLSLPLLRYALRQSRTDGG